MWIVFEGLDKSGKGTLEWEVLKATNFKHVVIDRGPAGYLVFDDLFKRRTKEGDNAYAKQIADMRICRDFIVIYCKAPVSIALDRIEANGETCPYNYPYAQFLYDTAITELYKKEGIKVITVDTSDSIEKCVKKILGGLK